jgi:hypothetical protein
MEDDRLDILEETKAVPGGAARRDGPIKVAAAIAEPAREGSTGPEDAIRSVYVARATSAATEVPAAIVETAGEGAAVRSAYVTHRFDGHADSVGSGELSGGSLLRSAYLAHIAAGPPRSGKTTPARQRKRLRRKAK